MSTYNSIAGVGAASSVSPTAMPKPSREPLVQVAMSELDRCVAMLHESIADLESRLLPILSLNTPTAQSGNQLSGGVPASLPMPSLVDAIRTVKNRIATADSRVRDLSDRLEL